MDHGAGKTIDRFIAAGIGTELDDGRVTRSYTNESSEPAVRRHHSDEGIDKVVEILHRHRVVRPIARIRPIAGYRYIWKGKLSRAKERLRNR